MNKRIKNKINKRIMEKLQSDNGLLTQFEYDYLLKCGPKDLKSKKINMKISDYIFKTADESLDKYKKAPAMLYWYADSVKVHPFQNLIDAMDSVDSLRYSLENIEAYHNIFDTDETESILSAGRGKMAKEESETYFKQIAEIDDEAYEDETSKWLNVKEAKSKVFKSSTKPEKDLNKNDLWYKPIEPKGVELHIFNGDDFVILGKKVEGNSSSLVSMAQNNNKITKKETKWNKAKGKLKGWFGK